MSDRTSADIFSNIFLILAKNPNEANKKLAKEIFMLTLSYDFDPIQMEIEEEAIKLGLARKGSRSIVWATSKHF